ncbi:hypothetical protein PoB_001480800 [Plakobranchus ocellatus]|uniref:Uncharacterized protein n=1 Tax=Plakobranchus ocellatus TaxID=259542 RepID=A0AAV3Z120_9GAST|nr:hypothetical protein PoB_001480800 [Plakobranchus ocellatus]
MPPSTRHVFAVCVESNPSSGSDTQSSFLYLQRSTAGVITFCFVRTALQENHTWLHAYLEKDLNKPLTQVKGLFDDLVTFGANNYSINVKENEKNFHVNLLKTCITKDTASDETPTVNGSVPTASLVIVEEDDEGSGCDDFGCEVLLELSDWGSK